MSTLIFILACCFLGMIVLSKIPGLEHLVKPMVGLLFKLIESSLTTLAAWAMYLLKTLLSSHMDLLKHLTLSAEKIDPSEAIDKDS